MAGLTLHLFGPPRLARAGVPVDLERRKATALLAYLAVSGQRQGRATLAALLWPEYDEERARATVLARILVGWLEDHREEVARFDVITTTAVYVGPQAIRLWDYLRLIVDAAGRESPDWPLSPGLIAKSGPTGRFLGISAEARREIAEGELRDKLSVPEPERVAGRRILVFDDIYSEGYSLREMARVLLEAGAAEVAGLVLARRKGG